MLGVLAQALQREKSELVRVDREHLRVPGQLRVEVPPFSSISRFRRTPRASAFSPRTRGRPHPVGQREPNGFGLYDVLGNAYEWVNDRFGPLGYGEGPFVDPVFGVDERSDLTPNSPIFAGKTHGLVDDGFPGYRVRRGGSFDLWPIAATSAWRLGAFVAAQHMGFRIARTLPVARKRVDQAR